MTANIIECEPITQQRLARPVSTGRKQDSRNLFKPGQFGNPKGRPKGSRNKLGEAFIADVYESWCEGGPDVIRRVREEHPVEFLKIVASLVPRTVGLSSGNDRIAAMSDEELQAGIDGDHSAP